MMQKGWGGVGGVEIGDYGLSCGGLPALVRRVRAGLKRRGSSDSFFAIQQVRNYDVAAPVLSPGGGGGLGTGRGVVAVKKLLTAPDSSQQKGTISSATPRSPTIVLHELWCPPQHLWGKASRRLAVQQLSGQSAQKLVSQLTHWPINTWVGQPDLLLQK